MPEQKLYTRRYQAQRRIQTPDVYSYGIVLSSSVKTTSRVLLLDAEHGKIICLLTANKQSSISSIKPMTGHCIEYTFKKQINSFDNQTHTYDAHITNWEHYQAPAQWITTDISFFHHILEITAKCTPPHQGACDVFELLQILYIPIEISPETTHTVLLKQTKLLILARLLGILGIYPDWQVNDNLIFPLISPMGDSMLSLYTKMSTKKELYIIDAKTEYYIIKWIERALIHHERTTDNKNNHFKTCYLFL